MRLNSPKNDSTKVGSSTVKVEIVAKDASGIESVRCSFKDADVAVSVSDSIYSATIAGLVVNQFNKIRFIAADASSNGNKETLFVFIKYDPTMTDTQKPTMRRKNPVQDSSSVGAASTTVSLVAEDASGIASVVCSFGDSTPVVTASDSVYSATIAGLAANQFNKIIFIATDASSNGNKETLFVFIKYDPTMGDNVAPIFTRDSGQASGSTVASAAVRYVFTITDDNGVDSVYWTLNGARQADLIAGGNGNQYSFDAALNAPHNNRIVMHAQDKSTNHNRDSAAIVLNYNQPPAAGSQTNLITPRATALPCTLKATDPENDPLSQWTVTGPKHGSITDTRPAFVYTPAGNYEGKDTLTFTVSDGIATSNAAMIVITVTANNIAPEILTITGGGTVDKGDPATFSATIKGDAYPTPVYRWVKNSTDTVISGTVSGTAIIYSINPTAYASEGNYKLVVRNSAGQVVSGLLALTVNDVVKPVITITGSTDTVIILGSIWTDPRGTVTDDKDGTIPTGSITITGTPPNTNTAGRWTLSYNVSDAAGNAAVTKQRTLRIEGWTKVDEFAGALFRTILNSDNVFYIPYIYNTTDNVKRISNTGVIDNLAMPSNAGAHMSSALGNDNKTLYIAQNGVSDIVKLNGGSWTTVTPLHSMLWTAYISLIIGPSNVAYVAGNYEDVFKNQIRKYTSNDWQFIGAEDFLLPITFDQWPDESNFCITSDGTIYAIHRADDSSAVECYKYSGGSWGSGNIVSSGTKHYYNDLPIVSNGSSVAAGFTRDYVSTNPAIYRLSGATWTALPSMAKNSNQGGGGFSMSYSTGGILFAAHPEAGVVAVARLNGSAWESVPSVGDRAAFTMSCDLVSIAGSADMCYVVCSYFDSGSNKIAVWQWKKQ